MMYKYNRENYLTQVSTKSGEITKFPFDIVFEDSMIRYKYDIDAIYQIIFRALSKYYNWKIEKALEETEVGEFSIEIIRNIPREKAIVHKIYKFNNA